MLGILFLTHSREPYSALEIHSCVPSVDGGSIFDRGGESPVTGR